MMLDYHPIPIVSWDFIAPGTVVHTPVGDFIAEPEQFVLVQFEDGTTALTKRHPTVYHRGGGPAKLYGAGEEDKRFFSFSTRGFNQIKADWNEAMARGEGGSKYPKLRSFVDDNRRSGILCHHAMYEIWHGARDPECEIHHKNGNKFDWCDNNLVQLESETEHPKWDNRLKRLKAFFREGILLWSHSDFDRWYSMPDSEFDRMLKIDRVDPLAAAAEERNKYA